MIEKTKKHEVHGEGLSFRFEALRFRQKSQLVYAFLFNSWIPSLRYYTITYCRIFYLKFGIMHYIEKILPLKYFEAAITEIILKYFYLFLVNWIFYFSFAYVSVYPNFPFGASNNVKSSIKAYLRPFLVDDRML